jgi:hypothetical protein
LHSITPYYFLEVSGGVIHPLSYQQAKNFCFHCGLVYVAEPGYMLSRAGVSCHSIIKKLAGKEIEQVEDFISILSKLARAGTMNASAAEQHIEPILVMFEVHIPPSSMLEGAHAQYFFFFGMGVVVYHSTTMGLVVVDKNTVSISVSDVMLVFAAYPMEIPTEVVFLHPIHNYALVAYDPAALGPAGAVVARATTLLPEPALRRGDVVYLVGLNRSLQATSRKSIVTNPRAALKYWCS